MRTLTIALAVLAAAPALAHDPVARQDDSNSYWLDYKTDVSEAKRELRKDLARATDREDVRDAWAEYRRELADARKDYTKEMREKGYRVGRVTVEN